MARVRARAVPTSAIALVAATAKTVLQLVAAANQRVACRGWSISFDGTVPGNGEVVVELVRQTTAGTASTTVTPVKEGTEGETLQTTMRYDFSAEPTTTDVLDKQFIHPQTGVEYPFAYDEEILIAGGGRLALRCTAPQNVNCYPKFKFEE